jgi:hypothetical protein
MTVEVDRKKFVYLVSLFTMILVFCGVFFYAFFKVSGSKYEELLSREAAGLPESRRVALAVRVKPRLSKDELENTLQYAYANELMDQIRKKQTLGKIVIHVYDTAADFEKRPDSAWRARLEKTGDEKEKIYFPIKTVGVGTR